MKVQCFEDLEIWKESRELCKIVYDITSKKGFSADFRFRDQMRAAAGSSMDNIAEGFGRGGNKEFCQYLSISLGSVSEVRSQAYRAYDCQYIDEEALNDILERTDKLGRKTNNFIKYLKSSEIKGPKYK